MAREITTGFTVENGTITAGTVKVECQVAEGKGADKVVFCDKLVHYLDFTGMKVEELADRAAGGFIIDLQNNIWRPSRFACQSESGKTTKLAEFISRERIRTAPDVQKTLLNNIKTGKMTLSEVQELIQQLQKMM